MWAVWRGMTDDKIYHSGWCGLEAALSQPGMEQQGRRRLHGKQSFRILPDGSFTKKAEANEGQPSGGI